MLRIYCQSSLFLPDCSSYVRPTEPHSEKAIREAEDLKKLMRSGCWTEVGRGGGECFTNSMNPFPVPGVVRGG